MSGVAFTCVSGEVSVVGGATDTIIGLAALANHRVHVKGVKLGFKGKTVTNEPVTVEYVRFTSDGTGTGGTVVKRDADASETVEAAFKHTYTVEPTGMTVLESIPIHPQGGIIEVLPIEAPIPVSGGDFWGVRITPDDTVIVIVTLICDE